MYKERNLLMDQVEALIVEFDKTNSALTEGANSYFISWLETVDAIRSGEKKEALSSLQVEFLRVITGCVLIECFET